MLKSGKRVKLIVCGLMALFSSASFAAWTTNVTDGTTFEMTSVAGTNAQTDFNVYASFIDCSGTCTVKILNDGGDDVRPRFRLAAGTVLTIDMTARSSSARFNGGLFAEEGAKIIASVKKTVEHEELKENYLGEAENMAHYHHEKWDGSGYPCGLKGEEIPLSARIMAVADVFDALVAVRVYKPAMPFEKALSIVKENSGKSFDPIVVEAFLHAEEKIRKVTSEIH